MGLVVENSRDSFLKKEKEAVYESFSFACGGWLQFYMFGVAKAIQERGIRPHIKQFAGCSAGALTAVGLALDGDFDKAIDFCKAELVPRCYHHWAGWGLFGIGEYASRCMDLTCNLHRWEELEPGQLHVAITRLPFFQAERQTSFESHADLKTALLASAGCFPFAPLVWRKGYWCIDGGLSDFQPVINEKTITVSPFYFADADIKPSRYVPLWWSFFPPKDEDTIEWLYLLGQEDAMTFFKSVDETVEQLSATPPSPMTSSSVGEEGSESIVTAEDSDTTPFFPFSPVGGVDDQGFATDEVVVDGLVALSPARRASLERSREERESFKRKRSARMTGFYKDSPHDFDIRGRVSFHRFLGYKTRMNMWVVYICDVALLAFLVLVWKPVALLAIYSELILRMTCHLLLSVCYEFVHLFPMIVLCIALCGPQLVLAHGLILLLLVQKIITVGPVVVFPAHRETLWQTFSCLFSLSLVLRFVSGGISAAELRKHDILVEHSMVYRIVRHII